MPTPAKPTALATFEARKANIEKLAKRFATKLELYDKAVSTTSLGHSNWGHAGTLAAIEADLEAALATLQSCTDGMLRK